MDLDYEKNPNSRCKKVFLGAGKVTTSVVTGDDPQHPVETGISDPQRVEAALQPQDSSTGLGWQHGVSTEVGSTAGIGVAVANFCLVFLPDFLDFFISLLVFRSS